MQAVDEAADRVSAVAFEDLGLKARGLGAQAAQHVTKRAVDVYAALRARLRDGNLGGRGPSAAVRLSPSRSPSAPMPLELDASEP